MRQEPTQIEHLLGVCLQGWPLALPTNIGPEPNAIEIISPFANVVIS